jgi:hypothetical protein
VRSFQLLMHSRSDTASGLSTPPLDASAAAPRKENTAGLLRNSTGPSIKAAGSTNRGKATFRQQRPPNGHPSSPHTKQLALQSPTRRHEQHPRAEEAPQEALALAS